MALLSCSSVPDVTYVDAASSGNDGDVPRAVTGAPDAALPDASFADALAPEQDSGAGEPCKKVECVGSGCMDPATCDRCKDQCKGATKKCCAGVSDLSCVSSEAACPPD